jgi:hypothetical protein
MPNYWREGTGCVVDRHMFQHVGSRLKRCVTNLVHADRISAIVTYHKSAADNPSGSCVHALSLHFNGWLRKYWDKQVQTLVTAALEAVFDSA